MRACRARRARARGPPGKGVEATSLTAAGPDPGAGPGRIRFREESSHGVQGPDGLRARAPSITTNRLRGFTLPAQGASEMLPG
jgi:hypothetical protein